MPQKAVPMIHVPDVRATMEWYRSIGCKVVRCNEEDGEINWALLTFGAVNSCSIAAENQVMRIAARWISIFTWMTLKRFADDSRAGSKLLRTCTTPSTECESSSSGM